MTGDVDFWALESWREKWHTSYSCNGGSYTHLFTFLFAFESRARTRETALLQWLSEHAVRVNTTPDSAVP